MGMFPDMKKGAEAPSDSPQIAGRWHERIGMKSAKRAGSVHVARSADVSAGHLVVE
jgi:hypothetical protein